MTLDFMKFHTSPAAGLTPRVKLRQNGTVFLMIKLAASMAGPGLNSKQIERRTSVSFSIKLAAFQASGGPDTRHLKPIPS
jgi:hypothetical protein